jgi:hypothetical protein
MTLADLEKRLQKAEQSGRDMQGLCDAQTSIIAIMERQLSLQRAAIWAMLSQASKDEVSQDPLQNPWLGLKSEFAGKINPLVKALNKLLGVEVKAIPEGAANSIVVATEIPRG